MPSVHDLVAHVDDEDVWVSEPLNASNPLHHSLKELEQQMRCAICGDFYHAPVSVIPCLHTFCSECIRTTFKAGLKSMKRTASCPVCRVEVNTAGTEFIKCLVPNRSVEELVSKFQGLREGLREALVAGQTSSTAASTAEVPTNGTETTVSSEIASKRRRSTRTTYQEDGDDDDDSVQVVPQPAAAAAQGEVVSRRPTKRRIPYKGLKKKQLQELCSKEGLSTTGTEQELKTRHETFLTLYNSECDSFAPRSHHELLKEMNRREKARRDQVLRERHSGAREHSVCMERVKLARKQIGEAAPGDETSALTSGNHKFDTEVKDNYAKLMAQARQNMQKKKAAAEGNGNETNEASSSGQVPPVGSAEMPSAATEIASVSNDATLDGKETSEITPTLASAMGALDAAPASESERRHEPVVSEVRSTEKPAIAQAPIAATVSEDSTVEQTTKRKAQTSIERAFRPKQKTVPDRATATTQRRSERSLVGSWECGVCTFLNETRTWSNATCEICSAKRTPKSKGVESAVSIGF